MRSLTRNQTRTANKANEILSTTEAEGQTQWATPEYDARGNMITMPKPDSPASAMKCVYDAWNRMVQAKNADGSIIATYRYDGLTRRIRKIVAGSLEVTYDYYHNPARQILETRKNGSTNPYEQYVWGLRYVHSPVLRWRDENTDGQDIETLHYTNDANFNVTALVDTSGNVVERYTYEPYGKVTFRAADWTVRQSSAYGNEILYTGHRLDTETGLYYGGWRYYHPTLGCWISRDPALEGLSSYEYAGSAPPVFVDGYGLWKQVNLQGQVEGDIWEAEEDGESLEELVAKSKYSDRSRENWACIKPRPDLTTDEDAKRKMPGAYDQKTAPKCARYDIGNLNDSWTQGEHSLALMVARNGEQEMPPEIRRLAKLWGRKDAKRGYIGSVGCEAKFGSNPLTELVVFGHCSPQGDQAQSAYHLLPKQWIVSYGNAVRGRFPPMCWFTHSATIWVVGCSTKSAAQDYAKLVRQDVTVWGTTRTMLIQYRQWGIGFRYEDKENKTTRDVYYNNMEAFLADPSWVSVSGGR